MKISIITPVWNRSDLTHTFLSSHWMRYAPRPDIEWIIIDNGSTDGTQQLLSTMSISMRHRLKVLTNTENKGFSAACNQGAAIATKGNTLIFVNNDVIINGDYIGLIRAKLDRFPCALVGPILLDSDTGWNKFGNVLVEYLPGWCLAIWDEIFNTLGGFDERYSPCDYEDIDLCYAATQAGLDLVAIPLPITHMDSQTARSYMPERREITERNKIKFKKKWRL